jgi:peptidyl-prolyl cis-trans isomerase A (cyclophilin A)
MCVLAILLAIVVAGPGTRQTDEKPVEVVVRIETSFGDIDLAIDVKRAPITAGNFLKYVDAGLYEGGRFHRATRADNHKPNPPNRPLLEIIQADINPVRAGERFPPIRLERTNITGLKHVVGTVSYPPISLERTSVTGLKHVDGAVSMARTGPDTATASFSIVIGDQPEMDFGGRRNPDGQGFAVFGRVVRGMDVVKAIQSAPTGNGGPYGTETLEPPIRVRRAYRK